MHEAWVIEQGNLRVSNVPGLGVDLYKNALLARVFRPIDRSEGPMRADGSIADP